MAASYALSKVVYKELRDAIGPSRLLLTVPVK